MALNISNMTVISSSIYNDANPPIVTLTTSAGVFKVGSGEWSLVLSNPTSVSCYWKMIGNSTAPLTPSLAEVISCSSTSICGNITVLFSGTTISSNSSNLIPLSNAYYSLFMVCYNFIPNAQMPSTVINAWTFQTGVGPSQTSSNNGTNTTAANNTNSTAANGTNSSSSGTIFTIYLSIFQFQIWIKIAFILFLF
jgi:hypothetical protein